MFKRKTSWLAIGTLALAAVGVSTFGSTFSQVAPANAAATEPTSIEGARFAVEIAEDGTRFVYDEEPRFANDLPAYGNAFVTQGYIYPAGTLTDTNGVLDDGSPEFPDRVIGEWTCWGYFIGDGAETEEGPWVITTQVFDFTSTVEGDNSIVTIGSETPAGAEPALRAVTGGTGRFARIEGDVSQRTLGHNVSDGVNAIFRFNLTGAGGSAVSAVSSSPAVDITRVPH